MAKYSIRGPEKIVGYCHNRTRIMAGYSTRGPEKMTGYCNKRNRKYGGHTIRGPEIWSEMLLCIEDQKIRPPIQSEYQKLRTSF